MKLEFLMAPTADLTASLALYRDEFGAEEVWREGETTAAVALPGSDVQLMLDATDPEAPAGPMFVVESVDRFHAEASSRLEVMAEPSEIPGGFLAVYRDPHGLAIYVMDQSTDQAAG